jgi:hypothetical protein
MEITDEEQAASDSATHCYICEQKLIRREDCANELDYTCFDTQGLNPVRYHCRVTSVYRGAAHSKCNLQHQVPDFYSVVIYNLSGFDAHLFIKELKGKIKCIPTTDEKCISFTREVEVDQIIDETGKKITNMRNLRLIDSYKFMPTSLDSLLKNLKTHPHLSGFYQGEQLELLLKKGVYPYEYVDSPEGCNETQLPPKEAFYFQLNGAGISDDEYKHAQKVWEVFNCKTFTDYHSHYNTADVLQLADLFDSFRDVLMKNYELDPAWHYTAPDLAWDACLKLTFITLELPQTYEMLLMMKSGIQGGISCIINRYAKTNNKFMADYNAKVKSTFIKYLDANYLYGWALCSPLPNRNFKWMDEHELRTWRSKRCILEVDLEYPEELHDLHNDYPLAPESLIINKCQKLVPNLRHKTKYVVHRVNLKLYERLGLKITKIHRGLSFDDSD